MKIIQYLVHYLHWKSLWQGGIAGIFNLLLGDALGDYLEKLKASFWGLFMTNIGELIFLRTKIFQDLILE